MMLCTSSWIAYKYRSCIKVPARIPAPTRLETSLRLLPRLQAWPASNAAAAAWNDIMPIATAKNWTAAVVTLMPSQSRAPASPRLPLRNAPL